MIRHRCEDMFYTYTFAKLFNNVRVEPIAVICSNVFRYAMITNVR